MKIKYTLTGLDCPNCAAKLEKNLIDATGLSEIKINFLTERLTVEAPEDTPALEETVRQTVAAFSKKIVLERQA